MLVIDASITIAWIIPDEQHEHAIRVRDRVLAEGAIVPSVWTLEVANILIMAERRNRMSAESVTQALAILQDVPIDVRPGSLKDDLTLVASAARDNKLTAYDAAYLTLARAEGLELATLDSDLEKAAERLGIRVLSRA